MSGGPQDLEIFNLALRVEPLGKDGYRARAVYRGPGVSGGITIWPSEDALQNLLQQIERQYHDFEHEVVWNTETADKRIELSWSMNQLGHVEQGHALLVDRVSRWKLQGALRGDQSYLPRVAMGLQLLLRA